MFASLDDKLSSVLLEGKNFSPAREESLSINPLLSGNP